MLTWLPTTALLSEHRIKKILSIDSSFMIMESA